MIFEEPLRRIAYSGSPGRNLPKGLATWTIISCWFRANSSARSSYGNPFTIPPVDVDAHLSFERVGCQLTSVISDLLSDLIAFIQRALQDEGVVDHQD